jgi:hypothetical protein
MSREITMKISTMVVAAVAAVVVATISTPSAPIASAAAYPVTGSLGSELTMTDTVGQVVLSWRVSDLKPSNDAMPGYFPYSVAGKLWEATTTVKSVQGTVTPAISQFNAIAPN